MYVERALHDLDSLSTDFSYLLIIILIRNVSEIVAAIMNLNCCLIVLDFENS